MVLKASQNDILAISKKPGGKIILRLVRDSKKIKLKELQDKLKNNISRATLFRRLKEMTERNILIQKKQGPKYGTCYSIPDENLKLIDEALVSLPNYQFEKDMIVSQISASKEVFKIIPGIYFFDPIGCWDLKMIKPYSKELRLDPSKLLVIINQMYEENAHILIDKFLSNAKKLIDSQESIIKKGYALGYTMNHLDWWCRSHSIDTIEVQSKIKKFIFDFGKTLNEHANEYVRKIKPLSKRQKEFNEFTDTPLGRIDLWFSEEIETLQQMGFLTEEDVYWLAALKEMGRLFQDCVKELPRDFPKIVVDTEPYG